MSLNTRGVKYVLLERKKAMGKSFPGGSWLKEFQILVDSLPEPAKAEYLKL